MSDSDTKESLMQDDSAGDVGGATASAPRAKAPKRGRKGRVVVGVLAAVAVVAVGVGAGLLVWHEQPSFCNAVCHSPMDSYVEDYYDGAGMARVHAEADVRCLDCHETTLDQQIGEGVAWLTGDFREKPDMMTDYDNETCLKCHISEEHVAAKTDLLSKNPHTDAHQKLLCTDCHKSHRKQVDYCASCHDNGGQRMIAFPSQGHGEAAAE